jgi:hypothetical protein
MDSYWFDFFTREMLFTYNWNNKAVKISHNFFFLFVQVHLVERLIFTTTSFHLYGSYISLRESYCDTK